MISLRRTALPAIALFAFFLGFAAYYGQVVGSAEAATTYDLFDAAYRSLQLFVLNREDPPRVGAALQIARFLAPLTTATAALLFVRTLLARWSLWWLRLRGGHRIVCGLGRRGLAFARAAKSERKRVVAIERRGDHPEVDSLRALGIPVIVGDAAEPATLRLAGIEKASAIVMACDSDDENVRISLRALELVRTAQNIHFVPHIHSAAVRTFLREKVQSELRQRRLDVELHDYCHETRAARELLHDHPLDHAPIGPKSPRSPLLVLIGFGRMGREILIQALKIAHYPNGKRLQVAIFDKDVNIKWKDFVGSHPNFADATMEPIADITRHQGSVLQHDQLTIIEGIASRTEVDTTIVVAIDDEAHSVAVVESLPLVVRERKLPVLVRIHERGGIADLLRGYRAEAGHQELARLRLGVFGEVETTATLNPRRFPHNDDFARAIHENYLEQIGTPATPRRSQLQWSDLDEVFRDSNRQAADFAVVLFRSFGFEIVEAEKARGRVLINIEDPALKIIGELEHRRWYAERYLTGWRQAPERDDSKRLHHSMCAWEDLPPEEKNKDLTQVGAYVGILDQLGYRVVKTKRGSTP